MRKAILLFALAALSLGYASAQETTTFILVRHAEKASDGTRDPGLTEEGEARSERFKTLFENAEIGAIYSSPYKRTRATVAPLASALSLEVKEYNPGSRTYINEILEAQKGKTVVISGHSNTIPFAANALLGKEQFQQFKESEYNNILVVAVRAMGDASVTVLNF